MTRIMPQKPIDALIRRLVGGEGPEPPLSAAEQHALRAALADGSGPEARGEADRDAAADHMRLAAYLDGSMTADERAAFEQELARSPAAREELISAVAWLDEVDAKRQSAPDHLVRQALALPAGPRTAGEAWWRGWLPAPGRGWVFAAAAIAGVLIALVAIQVVRQAPSSGPSFRLPDLAGRDKPLESRPAVTRWRITVSPELIAALLAYDRNPEKDERARLAARLKEDGTIPIELTSESILVEQRLRERLQRNDPPAAIFITRSADNGSVILSSAD